MCIAFVNAIVADWIDPVFSREEFLLGLAKGGKPLLEFSVHLDVSLGICLWVKRGVVARRARVHH